MRRLRHGISRAFAHLIGVAAILLLLPAAALAQLQISAFDGINEQPISGLYDAGTVAIGDSIEIRIRVRNLGATALNIQTLAVAGTAFTITARPTLPYVLAPGSPVDFRVGFTPTGLGSFSASVAVNSQTVFLRAIAALAAEVAQGTSTSRVVVPGGATLDLGRVQRGQTGQMQMFLHNPGTQPLRVASVTVSGEGFAGPAGIHAPVTLANGEWLPFLLAFTPTRTGDFTGKLTVDQRTFPLAGFSFQPTLPKPSVVVDTTAAASGEQHTVSLRFAQPAPVGGTGTLQLFFDTAVTGAAADPAILFVKSGARLASFTVNQGDTVARFGADSGIVFQTGTTAGTIRFQITMTGATTGNDLTLILPQASPVIDLASATRRTGDLDITLAGFDNTYSMGAMTFTFYDPSGRVLDPGPMKADFSSTFKAYFPTSGAGSAFQMRATFPVSGDATQVAGVEVEITNAAGSVKTKRLVFP